MAKNLKGITIEIDGNTTGLTNALGKVNTTIGHLNSELKAVDKLLKLDPTNTELLAQKQDVLSSAIKETVDKLQTLKLAKEQADEKIANGKEEMSAEAYRELEREIIATEQKLGKLTDQYDDNEQAMNGNTKEIKEFSEEEEKAGNSTLKLGDLIKANLISSAIKSGLKALANSIKDISGALNDYIGVYQNVEEQEQKFRTAIQNTTDATEEDVQAYVKLAAAKEKNGVVSKSAILNGYQELATYTTQKDSIEKLTDAMLDMTVQQYGMNASEEQTLSIATRLGKALSNGDYSGLAKMGYYFTDAEKQAMKFGTEEDRVNALLEAITGSVGGMNEALAQTDAGRAKIAASNIEDMKESVGKLASEIKNNLIGSLSPAIQEVSNAIQGMINGDVSIEEGMQQIGNGVINAVETIGAKLPELIDAGAKILMSILDGISSNTEKLVSTINQVITTLLNSLIPMFPQLLKIGIQVISFLITGIGQQLPSLIPQIIEVVLTMVETLLDNIDLLVDSGISLLLGLCDGLMSALPILIDKIPIIVDKLITALTNNAPKLLEMGITLVIKLAEGLIKAIPQLVSKTPQIITSLVNGLLIGVSKVKEVGKNLISGLWNGIKEKWEGLKKSVENLGKGIVDKFKSVFGIKSPSKVMRDEVGKYLVDGIGVGVEKEVPNVIKDVNNAMNTLTKGIQASVNPVINPTANSNPLILQIENFNNARGTDVQALAEELEFYRRNTALAKGGN